MATIPARMQQRRRTAAQWTSENPTGAAGELGYESDTGNFKIFDGTTAWNSLGYTEKTLDIRRFGATPSVARSAIQTAVDQASTLAGSGVDGLVVYVPPGTWQLDDSIVVPNNVTLRGTGSKSILRLDNSINNDVIDFGEDVGGTGTGLLFENITIEQLVIDGNRYNQTGTRHGINAQTENQVRDIRLRDLIIRNCGAYGIGLQGNAQLLENVSLENIYIENVGTDGIDIKCQATRNCSMRNIGVNYFGTISGGVDKAAIDLGGTWTVHNVDIRSVRNDLGSTNNAGIRFRQSGAGSGTPVTSGALGCTVQGVTVALTGAAVSQSIVEQVAPSVPGWHQVNSVNGGVTLLPAQVILVTENGDVADQTSYQTATVTPPPNKLLLLSVVSAATNPNAPTVTGCGVTWTQVATRLRGTGNRLTVFRAMGWFHTPPTTGQLTIDFGGQTQDVAVWRLEAVENVSLVSDADAIVQSASIDGNTGAEAVTLAAFNQTNNSTWSSWAILGTGSTVLGEDGYGTSPGTEFAAKKIAIVWRPDDDTTPGITYTATAVIGIAVELRVARP